MRLTARMRDAMAWLGEPATPETFVTDEMLIELESLGIIDYDRETGTVDMVAVYRRRVTE